MYPSGSQPPEKVTVQRPVEGSRRRPSGQEIEAKERQHSTHDLARCLALMKQVERVRSVGVIHQRHGQVASQSLRNETVECFVQSRHLVVASSRQEQWNVAGEVLDGLSGARIDETELPSRISDARR